MGHRWMIDVLADLETFADRNGLPVLAQKLAETAGIAAAEIGIDEVRATPALSPSGGIRGTDGTHGTRPGEFSRGRQLRAGA